MAFLFRLGAYDMLPALLGLLLLYAALFFLQRYLRKALRGGMKYNARKER